MVHINKGSRTKEPAADARETGLPGRGKSPHEAMSHVRVIIKQVNSLLYLYSKQF